MSRSKLRSSRSRPLFSPDTGLACDESETCGSASENMWPTPESKLASSGPDYARATRDGSGGDDLCTAVARDWPTPKAIDAHDAARLDKDMNVMSVGGDYLKDAIRRCSPTSMSSSGAFPVKTSPSRASVPVLTLASAADSGGSSADSLASYDPVSRSWKMSQVCLWAGLDEYSETWPKSGMTRSGRAFARPMWARRTAESACSSWPTPDSQVTNERGASQKRDGAPSLAQKACWPTATAEDDNWITPQTRDHKGISQASAAGTFDGSICDQLAQLAGRPAPASRNTTGSRPESSSVVLNPAWVECLMGFPPGWTDVPVPTVAKGLPRSATPSSPKSPKSSRKRSPRSSTGRSDSI